jgi:hypothetical protein
LFKKFLSALTIAYSLAWDRSEGHSTDNSRH